MDSDSRITTIKTLESKLTQTFLHSSRIHGHRYVILQASGWLLLSLFCTLIANHASHLLVDLVQSALLLTMAAATLLYVSPCSCAKQFRPQKSRKITISEREKLCISALAALALIFALSTTLPVPLFWLCNGVLFGLTGCTELIVGCTVCKADSLKNMLLEKSDLNDHGLKGLSDKEVQRLLNHALLVNDLDRADFVSKLLLERAETPQVKRQ